MPRYYVQTDQPNGGGFIAEFTLHCGSDLARAERAYANERDNAPRYSVRRLVEYDFLTGETINLKERVIYRRIDGPVEFDEHANRMIQRWSNEKNKVAQFIYLKYTTNKDLDYVSFQGGEFSYLPDGKPPEYNHDNLPFGPANRQSGKPAKIARKILTQAALDQITDNDFEAFATMVKADMDRANKITVVRGDDIAFFYDGRNYASGTASLGSSCMRYDRCQEWFGLYTRNPEQIGMAIMLDEEGLLKGRALLWTLDSGETYQDRVYGTSETIRMFQNNASKQGWLYKTRNGPDGGKYVTLPDGSTDARTMFCTVPNKDQYTYPYMDTFMYIDKTSGRLTNDPARKHTNTMRSTEGGISVTSSFNIWPEEDGGTDLTVIPCRNCGTLEASMFDDHSIINNQRWCVECRTIHFRDCARCHAQENRHASYHVGAEYYCRTCYGLLFYTCQRCGNSYRISASHFTDTDRYGVTYHYCNDCADFGRAFRCYACARSVSVRQYSQEWDRCITCRDAAIATGQTLDPPDEDDEPDEEEYDPDDEEDVWEDDDE